jgi:hypothetical protein
MTPFPVIFYRAIMRARNQEDLDGLKASYYLMLDMIELNYLK